MPKLNKKKKGPKKHNFVHTGEPVKIKSVEDKINKAVAKPKELNETNGDLKNFLIIALIISLIVFGIYILSVKTDILKFIS